MNDVKTPSPKDFAVEVYDRLTKTYDLMAQNEFIKVLTVITTTDRKERIDKLQLEWQQLSETIDDLAKPL